MQQRYMLSGNARIKIGVVSKFEIVLSPCMPFKPLYFVMNAPIAEMFKLVAAHVDGVDLCISSALIPEGTQTKLGEDFLSRIESLDAAKTLTLSFEYTGIDPKIPINDFPVIVSCGGIAEVMDDERSFRGSGKRTVVELTLPLIAGKHADFDVTAIPFERFKPDTIVYKGPEEPGIVEVHEFQFANIASISQPRDATCKIETQEWFFDDLPHTTKSGNLKTWWPVMSPSTRIRVVGKVSSHIPKGMKRGEKFTVKWIVSGEVEAVIEVGNGENYFSHGVDS